MRVLLAIAAMLAVAAFLAPSATAGEKVTICHATGSDTKFVEITISENAWTNGHSPHAVHVDDYIGKCEVLTSSIEITPTSDDSRDTIASSIVVPPSDEPGRVPLALPQSGGAP